MASDADQIHQIEAAEDARFAAVRAADTSALAGLLHDQLVYMHSSGIADTKQSYIAGLSDGTWIYRAVDRSEQRIEVRDGVALVFNRLHLDLIVKGVPKDIDARALSVWVRETGRWQLIAVHSGAVPQQAG
jgi:ketosteroid isomerase-like protein